MFHIKKNLFFLVIIIFFFPANIFAKTDAFFLEYAKIIPLHFFGIGPQYKTNHIFLNPAGIGPLAYPQLNFNFGQNYFGYNYLSMAGNIPVGTKLNLGASIEYFYCDDIPRTVLASDNRPEIESYFGDKYTRINLAMHFPVFEKVYTGLKLHLDQQQLDTTAYENIYGDLGVRFTCFEIVHLGFFSDNLLKIPVSAYDNGKKDLGLDQTYNLEMHINLSPLNLGHIYSFNHNHTTYAEMAFGEYISFFVQTCYDNKLKFKSYSISPIINLMPFGIQYTYKRIFEDVLDSSQHFLGIQINFAPMGKQ